MKKRKGLIVFLVLLSCYATAQLPKYAGTKTPYTDTATAVTAPPAGFDAVWVNYVGRHGARFLTKAGSDTRVLQLLLQAEKAQGLTALGKRIKVMVERFLTIETNNYENISLLGANEQAGIGKRMLQRNAKAFKGRGLLLQVTHKIRTKQSADAFLSSFTAYPGAADFEMVRDADENELRFYDLSPAYHAFKKSAAVTERTDSLEKDARTALVASHVSSQLLKRSFIKALRKQAKENLLAALAEDLYDLYSVQFSIPMEMRKKGYTSDSINFTLPFTSKDLAWMDFKSGGADFLEKGAGLDTLGIQVRIAAPLLVDFIQTTDAAVKGNNHKDAVLRFTHAEAISPFATLLGIPQASVSTATVYNYDKHWQASGIIPLSANIQWVLYSNGTDYLVKVLLNEREVALPVQTSQYPYYSWEAVKTYYLAKLKMLGVVPGDDMHKYLLEAK